MISSQQEALGGRLLRELLQQDDELRLLGDAPHVGAHGLQALLQLLDGETPELRVVRLGKRCERRTGTWHVWAPREGGRLLGGKKVGAAQREKKRGSDIGASPQIH